MSEPALRSMPDTRTAPMRSFALVSMLCGLMGMAYGFVNAEPNPALGFMLSLMPLVMAALWFQADTRLRGISLVHDWGLLGYIIWPFYLPWYAYRTRGRRGWRLALRLVAGILAPQIGAMVGAMLSLFLGTGAW